MRNRNTLQYGLIIGLFLLICYLSSQRSGNTQTMVDMPRAEPGDATPLGGLGLKLLLGRMGYTAAEQIASDAAMPRDAKLWILVDPETALSNGQAKELLKWVSQGGTLIFAPPLDQYVPDIFGDTDPNGIATLKRELGVTHFTSSKLGISWDNGPFPDFFPLEQSTISNYWQGVKKAEASSGALELKGSYHEIAGNLVGTQIARKDRGKGRIILLPDAFLCTNYALAHDDNAVFMANLIQTHVPKNSGTVYFDLRQTSRQGPRPIEKFEPTLAYYLWRPPLRYAMLQLLGAVLLVWALYGRRLGAAVPLPENESVTRASRYAVAMGGLFHNAGKAQAAGTIIGDDFRRSLVHRLGMAVSDTDAAIAARAAAVSDVSARVVERLLEAARTPHDEDMQVLNYAQQMENLLQKLDESVAGSRKHM